MGDISGGTVAGLIIGAVETVLALVAGIATGRLRAKPMNTWPRYWQDAAFHTVINWDHTLSGAGHWAGGRWHC